LWLVEAVEAVAVPLEVVVAEVLELLLDQHQVAEQVQKIL
jgi:hypothetical protein